MMKLLVIGDSCEDVYIYGSCDRLCPDAPVPVMHPVKTVKNGGMALHVRENLFHLCKENPNNVVDIVTQEKKITKTRYVDIKTNHMFIRIDSDIDPIERISQDRLSNIDYNAYDAIIISDYCKGFLAEEDIRFICSVHPHVFIDTKKHLGEYCNRAFLIKINELEYNNTKKYLTDKIQSKLIVTLGDRGARYNGKIYPVDAVEVKDMTGAGDTFISSLCFYFVKTKDIEKSVAFANICSTIVVQQRGVTVVGFEDIIDHL